MMRRSSYYLGLVVGVWMIASPLFAQSDTARRDACTALRAAIGDLMTSFPESYPHGAAFLARLDDFERRPDADMEIFRALQREALLENPLVKKQPIVYVARRQYKPDHHNTETMFQTGEINTAGFEGGGALRVVDSASGGAVNTLIETPQGIVRDPEISFDGRRILFSLRHNIEDDYHIYEMNADGTGLHPLTSAQGVSDIDPLYLPGGDIIFSSTREPKYCMCNRHIMCNLFRMSGDGANIHQIGKSTLFEGQGALMPDGRILYNRWEYIDRNFGDAQGLWTVFPDGSNHAVYWGNNTQSPGAILNARPIPGTEQVLCIFGSCHDRPWGALAIIDRRLGMDGATEGKRSPSVIRTWPPEAINLVGEGDWNAFNFDTFKSVTPRYEDPFPLNDRYFLCSRTIGVGEVMGIFLIDIFGNELLIHAEGTTETALGCYDPMPLKSASPPPAVPVRRNYEKGEGTFYIADVYRGTHMKGVERGAVKYIRVIASPEKRFWTQPAWDGQGQEAPAMGWHDFNNKKILGTAPVEEDGSAYFSVPADTYVYFQLLDEKGMMIQSMRSGAIIQSGEQQGCVGCHEDRRSAAPLSTANSFSALRRPPSVLADWHGPARNFSYLKEVQPVFDKYCVRCHDYGKPAGKALLLSGDRDMVFNTSYNELWRKKLITEVGAGPAQTQPAYSWGSHAGKLGKIIQSSHSNVRLDPESFDRLVTWMDINAPYYPDYASAYPDNPAGRSPLDGAQIARLAELTKTPINDGLSFSRNQGPQITFDRPECSPCLKALTDKASPEYQEALQIIQAGKALAAQRPDVDSDGFIACPVDQRRQEKYAARQEEEWRNRAAIRAGIKAYDTK